MNWKTAILFMLVLSACTVSREAKIKDERRNHDKYLKARINILNQNDTSVNVSLRIKNKARFVTYQSIEVEAWLINEKGDTLGISGHAGLCDLAPGKRISMQTDFMKKTQGKITKMPVGLISGTPKN